MEFRESDLTFSFPPDWIVRKYDDTVAYQSLSGHGLKGVDFLCLAPNDELWLIEVKNYRDRSDDHRAVRRTPTKLAQHVGKKFADTRRLIRIVNASLRRKWWVRWQLAWYAYRQRPRPASNYWFWTEAERRLADPDKLVLLLWLETPERNQNYEEVVKQELRPFLFPGNRLQILETQRKGNVAFTVTK